MALLKYRNSVVSPIALETSTKGDPLNLQEAITYFADTPSDLPAYKRIQLLITHQIKEGTLKPGDPIPSENELVQGLKFSRMTVNRAMRELSVEGVLTRTRGIGTFVAEPKHPGDFMEIHNIADEIKERGHHHTEKVLKLEKITREDNAEYWQAGQVPEELGSEVFHSVVVHFDNGSPFQIEENFVNPELAPDYLEQDFTQITPGEYFEKIAPKVHGVNSVDAILPSKDQFQILEMQASEPCLRIERHTYTSEDILSSTCLLHPGNRIQLKGDFGVQ